MGVHPYLAGDLALVRQSDLLAQADHERLVRLAGAADERRGRLGTAGARLGRLGRARAHERWPQWQHSFCRLVAVLAHPVSRLEHDPELLDWVEEQQRLHRLGVLGRRRTFLLEALPEWTWEGAPRDATPSCLADVRLSPWAVSLLDHLRVESDYRQLGLVRVLC